jgi:hypothetical protein
MPTKYLYAVPIGWRANCYDAKGYRDRFKPGNSEYVARLATGLHRDFTGLFLCLSLLYQLQRQVFVVYLMSITCYVKGRLSIHALLHWNMATIDAEPVYGVAHKSSCMVTMATGVTRSHNDIVAYCCCVLKEMMQCAIPATQ